MYATFIFYFLFCTYYYVLCIMEIINNFNVLKYPKSIFIIKIYLIHLQILKLLVNEIKK